MKHAVRLSPIMLASVFFLTGCHGGSAAGSAPSATAGPTAVVQLAQNEGKLAKLDRSDKVPGPDTDGNGVRDDIDAYLQQRFPNAPQRAAAAQMAKVLQSAVVTGGNDRETSINVSRELDDAVHCLFIRFNGAAPNSPGAVSNELEAITANTKPRLLAYLAFNKSLNGTASPSSVGDTCEE